MKYQHTWYLTIFILINQFSENSNILQDYEGQGKAEKFSRFIITLFGIVGLVWGGIIQQFSQTVYILGAGFLLSLIVALPPWPLYRKNPVAWQKSRNTGSPEEVAKKAKTK